jgi:hypothetical protein
MKDAYWFPHDSNARHDPKICSLIRKCGVEGYGMYWIVVEMLRDENDHEYALGLDEDTMDAIADQCRCESEKARQFVLTAIRLKLFGSDEESFWSPSLRRRMERRAGLSQARAEAGQIGGKRKAENWQSEANSQQTSSKPLANPSEERRGEESISKKSRGEETLFPFEITPLMADCFEVLQSVKGYPFNEQEDAKLVTGLVRDFPGVDILLELRSWERYKMDKPLEKKSSPRAQIGTWMRKAREFHGNGDGHEEGSEEPVNWREKTAEEIEADYDREMRKAAGSYSPAES